MYTATRARADANLQAQSSNTRAPDMSLSGAPTPTTAEHTSSRQAIPTLWHEAGAL